MPDIFNTPYQSNRPWIAVEGIWLLRDGDKVIVRAEIDGKWIDVIREHHDGMFSHIVEPAGMAHAVKKMEQSNA